MEENISELCTYLEVTYQFHLFIFQTRYGFNSTMFLTFLYISEFFIHCSAENYLFKKEQLYLLLHRYRRFFTI